MRIFALLTLLCSTIWADAATPAKPEPNARFLVIALDAVPFQAARDLTRPTNEEPQLLQGLAGPVPLVSTFPSNTSVALTAILQRFGLDLPPGYEVKFYDREADKIRGGGLIAYRNIRFDWHHFFDWQLHGFFGKSLAYARPRHYSVKEVDKAIEEFVGSSKRAFFVYVNSTDAIGHILGPEGLLLAFENLDKVLAALRASSPEPVYTVVFSDHGLGGGVPLPNARASVIRALEASGWRTAKKLGKPGDVVLTPFGLVSSFEAYTHPGEEREVAETLVGAKGVDLCAYREGPDWVAVNQDGRATIQRREEAGRVEWSYTIETADPLRLQEVVARLRSERPTATWFDERAWFDETWNESYPDPLFRIAAGFERVRNPASILCSISNGYLYGSKSAFVSSKMSVGAVRWTHGALLRGETHGFLMTDYPGWNPPAAVRFDGALDFLADYLAGDVDE